MTAGGARAGSRGLVARWTLANAGGELVGLGGVALLAVSLVADPGPATAGREIGRAATLVGAGALEGAVVGVAQWVVLRRVLPGVTARAWVGATVAGAAIAWALGMVPSTVVSLARGPADAAGGPGAGPSPLVMYPAAALLGAALGVVLASVQYRVLRRHLARARRWLPANAAAWAVGMPLVFGGIDAAVATGRTGTGALVVAASLLAAGAAVGAIEGWALDRMLDGGGVGRRAVARAA